MSASPHFVNEACAMGAFLAFHLLPGTRLREALVGRIGRKPWLWVFSLVTLAQFAWGFQAYTAFRHDPGDPVLWDVHPVTRDLQIGLQFIAFLFIVIGLMGDGSKAPWPETSSRAESVGGLRRITRHPFLWGAAIWATGHMLVNGDVASLILFGGALFLSVAGMIRIDARQRRTLGPTWAAFAQVTSAVPFVAIAQGRQSLRLGEIGAWRVVLAVSLWAAMLWLHPYVIGVKALP